MTPSARRTLLEGLLLTLEGDGAGKSNAVATARAVLAGDDKPRMTLNAARVSGREITETAAKIRAEIGEADTRGDHPSGAGCPLPHEKMAKRGKRICPECNKPLTMKDYPGLKKTALPLSEAGYPGHESLDRSPKKNWVERAGQLPSPIQHMAKDIHEERGLPLDQAIPIAISQAKKLAAKGNQKYVRAVAEWEELKAKNAAKGAAKKLAEHRELEELWSPQARLAAARERHQHSHAMGDLASTGMHPVSMEAEDATRLAFSRNRTHEMPVRNHSQVAALHADTGEVVHGHLAGLSPAGRLGIQDESGKVHHFQPGTLHAAEPLRPVRPVGADRTPDFGGGGLHSHESKGAMRRAESSLREAKTTTLPKNDDEKPEKPEEKAESKADKADKPTLEGAGKRVLHLQNRLNELGFDTTTDGKFGPKTAESVKQFQRHAMLKDDGIVGPVTTNALKAAPHAEHVQRANAPDPVPVPGDAAGAEGVPQESAAQQRKADDAADAKGITNEQQKTAAAGGSDLVPMLMKGAGVGEKKGDSHVRQVQSSLASAGVDINADGRFGPDTEKKVKSFQRKWGLKTDGVVGEKTRRALAHVAGKHAKLHEAVAERKWSEGAEFGRALAREQVIRRELEEGRDLEEFWSPAARLASARARHSRATPDLGEKLHSEDWAGRRHGEYPAEHTPGEGERGHIMAPNGQRVFGTMRGGKLVDDSGSHIPGDVGEHPKGVTDEKGYLAKARASDTQASDEIRARVAARQASGVTAHDNADTAAYFAKRAAARKLHEAKHRGDARKIVEIHRLPNGHFAPKGQGQVLKPGMRVHLGDEVGEVTTEIAKQGLLNKTGKPAVDVEFDDGSHKTVMQSNPADAAQGAGTADKHEKGFQDEDGPQSPGSGDLSDSPGRGPTGKLRNFKAMTPVKLKKVIGDLEDYGKDDEALSAIKKVAKEKGVAWGDAPQPAKSKPSQYGIVDGKTPQGHPVGSAKDEVSAGILKGGSGMSANKGNLSLKDMPLGSTFEMNDGSQYKLHKAVGDPFYIVKPLDGGKAKPLHKMFAPPKVGPIADGYEGMPDDGSAMATPGAPAMAGVAPATPGAGDSNDLFGMLSKSVDVAAQAKATGQKPNFAAAKTATAAPPAPGPAAPGVGGKLPQEVALEAYLNAGGNDPGVITALKKQMMQAASCAEDLPLALREDWATFDKTRKSRGLGQALSGAFGVRRPGQGNSDPKEGFHEAVAALKPGQTMHVPLPEGEMKVTHQGSRRFHIEGGGHSVDPDLRRGTRELPGRGATAHEMAERVKASTHADFADTAHHTGRVLSAQPGERVHMESIDGQHTGTIHKGQGKFVAIDHASGSKSEHATADGAVRHLKKKMRAKGATFLPEGHQTDPLAKESDKAKTEAAAKVKARDPGTAGAIKERVEKYNPDGVGGDIGPDYVAELAKGSPLSATKLTGPSEVGARYGEAGRETVEKVAHRAAQGPRSPGVGHHVAGHVGNAVTHATPHLGTAAHHAAPALHHIVHLVAARIDRERVTVRRLEESGDHADLLRARARLRCLSERLATLQQ